MKLKVLPEKADLTEEEQDELDEYALDIELFEKHEMPIFLDEMKKYGNLEPEKTLEAMSAIFWWGVPATEKLDAIPPARHLGEIGQIFYEALNDKIVTHKDVAWILNTTLSAI